MASIPGRRGFVALSGACLTLVACGTPSAPASAPAAAVQTQPSSTAAPTATTFSPPTATTLVSPTASPTPASAAAQPSSASPAASAAAQPSSASPAAQPSSAPPPAAGDVVKLTINPDASEASFHAREQLAGNAIQTDAVGISKVVSGNVVLAADGSVLADQSQITVDLSKLVSDESRRDNFIKTNTLQTGQYPNAVFVPREAPGLPKPLPTSGEASFQLSGDLTVHGATKPVVWQVMAQFAGPSVSGNATTTVNLTDFGMTPPRVGPVLSVEDALRLELAFATTRET